LKGKRIFFTIFGIVLTLVCSFFSLLFVGLALKWGLFEAWLYVLPLFLGIMVGITMAAGKSLRLALKAWLGFVIMTLFPFTAFIIVLQTLYQILSITLIVLTVSFLVYVYRNHARVRLRKVTSTQENLPARKTETNRI